MAALRNVVPFCAVALLVLSGCGGSSDAPAARTTSTSTSPSADEAAVRLAFDRYKDAALAGDGAAAAAALADTTASFYDEARNAALTATKRELASLPPVQRLTALVMRGTLASDTLRSSSPEGLLVAAVDAGLIGEQGVKNVEIGEVTVSGDTATASAVVGGSSTPVELAFTQEGGEWKFDLLPLLEVARAGFEGAAQQQGVSVDQLVETLLTQRFGQEKYVELVNRPVGR